MTKQDPGRPWNLDVISSMAFAAAFFAALGLYLIFYAPGIDKEVRSGFLPSKEILWLQLHIVTYWISYFIYFTGLLLAILCVVLKATTHFPWIELITIAATILTLVGLVTGILYSKPAWNVWWVWDIKHVVALLNIFVLTGISFLAVLLRSSPNKNSFNGFLIVLLFVAVATCMTSLLAGFMRNVHPQWWLGLFFE